MPRRRRSARIEMIGDRPFGEFTGIGEGPVLPVRDTVLYPHMVTTLIVGRDRSLRAIEEALAHDRTIVIVAQRDPDSEGVTADDLHSFGTEAVIGRKLNLPDGTISVLVQGQRRVRLNAITQTEPYIRANYTPIEEPVEKTVEIEAQMKAMLALFEKCVKLSHTLPDDAYVAALNIEEPGWLADLIASNLELSTPRRQELLEIVDPYKRLEQIGVLLAKELSVLELESKIHDQVQQGVDEEQREYYLREQMKQIQRELGENDPQMREVTELRDKIETSGMPEEVAKKAYEELDRMAQMPSAAPEVGVIRNYVDWLVSLPWKNASSDDLNIKHSAEVLDSNHYGLPKVKERILEYMAVRKLAADKMRSPILCFVGPPGVGKTSLGRSIATALGRKFVRVSLGGVRDEAEIRGHRRTYIGALPGRIIQTMKNAGTINPVFMMDEIDKVGIDYRGDPTAALLEVLDPEQNSTFVDHYLDVPYDLSKVMFITTANLLDPIPPPLLDRMEVIELPGYTEDEKLHIAKQFLVPKQIKSHGLTPDKLRFSDDGLRKIIREYTHEAGVRSLEREIGSICRKIAKRVADGQRAPTQITSQSVGKYLGVPRFSWSRAEENDEIGVATGVYWTETGGDLATVEATLLEGKGNLILTGQLGDVMKESANAAMSYTRARAKELGIPDKFYEKLDVHIHLPSGAIPKDGPSAGITMATALISALTRRPVRREVAMTGEITLRGRVLPIGGLKEKVLAAHRGGIKTFILPKKNEKDLHDIPQDVMRALNFVYVERMDDVLPYALQETPVPPLNGKVGESEIQALAQV